VDFVVYRDDGGMSRASGSSGLWAVREGPLPSSQHRMV
jgi:hypothetical protein